jgi:hypothetical protein
MIFAVFMDLPRQFISISPARPPRDAAEKSKMGWAYSDKFEVHDTAMFGDLINLITTKVYSPIAFIDGRRRERNFVGAVYAVLDFDENASIEYIDEYLRSINLFFVIATSLNHRKEKRMSGGRISPAQDRFRLILMFSEVINDLRTYNYNMELLCRVVGADPGALGGSRFFFNSPEVISFANGIPLQVLLPSADYGRVTLSDSALQKKDFQKQDYIRTGKFHGYIERFLARGERFADSYHMSILKCASALCWLDVEESECVRLIKAARPMFSTSRQVSDAEIINTIKDGYTYVRQRRK